MVLCSGNPIKFGSQECKFIKDFQFKDMVEIVSHLINSLIKVDDKTGAPIVDGINYEPLCVYHILHKLTDINLDEYKEDTSYKIEDDFCMCQNEDLAKIYLKVTEFYEAEEARFVDEINAKNSVGAHIRGLIGMLLGEDTGKNVGVIRKILTELAIKNFGEEKKSDTHAPRDFSEFKVKKV